MKNLEENLFKILFQISDSLSRLMPYFPLAIPTTNSFEKWELNWSFV
jgi:hypothetical protein